MPDDVDLAAAFRSATGRDLPLDRQPWDEGLEQRLAFVADTYDPDTGRSRPLRPRRDRPKT